MSVRSQILEEMNEAEPLVALRPEAPHGDIRRTAASHVRHAHGTPHPQGDLVYSPPPLPVVEEVPSGFHRAEVLLEASPATGQVISVHEGLQVFLHRSNRKESLTVRQDTAVM